MKRSQVIWLIVLVILPRVLFSQTFVPEDIDSTGNPQNKRMGIHNANQVRTMFYNQGEVGEWKHPLSGEWPRGTGHTYLDGNALIVGAAVVDRNGKIIHPVETMYREGIRPATSTTQPPGEYGWQPLPGYFNPNQNPLKESWIAMSDQSDTWPDRWPDRPDWVDISTGKAVWNGYFGRGITNADQESYFVMDDDYDEDFNFFPDSEDSTRRGLGLRVAVRGLQWVHVLAEDVIFWHYEITNVGNTDYDSVYFGMYFDTGIGGEGDSDDDDAHYDQLRDITFVSDQDEASVNWPGKTGWVGYAFLESPGIGDVYDENGVLITLGDGVDNDDDGLIDESRSNDAGIELNTYPYGVDDVDKFIAFYGRAPKPHWSGDEDQDWDSYEDFNGNNMWDPGEPLNDDVGFDGSSPLDADYPGPDLDGTEANGKPDQGEPDFGKVDKDESDQIGLTSAVAGETHVDIPDLFQNENIWEIFSTNKFDTAYTGGVNTAIYYGSGPFPLKGRGPGEEIGQTERFSIALVFGDDEDDLLRNRRTVQRIYNANYNFSEPPLKPELTVIPGDNKVTLYWDSVAEGSFDKFLNRKDFEGYMIYKSTENTFHEIYQITDAYGSSKYYKPVAQFDLDNGLKGLHPEDVDGIKFYLGDDTGLVHSWVDRNVFNGQTYYYALVSYDQGDTLLGAEMIITADGDTMYISREGLAPTTCAARIERDVSGNVWTDINTAVVTPNAPAAGYIPSEITDITHLPWQYGTGSIEVKIVDPRLIKSKTYQVIFTDDSTLNHRTLHYSVLSDGDTLILESDEITGREGPFFEDDYGLSIHVYNDEEFEIVDSLSGWTAQSNCNYSIGFTKGYQNPVRHRIYPINYEVRFFDHIVDTSHAGEPENKIPTNFQVWDVTEPDAEKVKFYFYDNDTSGTITINDSLVPYYREPRPRNYRSWKISFSQPQDISVTPIEPQAGDILKVTVSKPFRSGDVFEFTTYPAEISQNLEKMDMDRIAVVPNPYVATAVWEPNPPYSGYQGRYERKIDFIHLPQKATIRIYTTRGYLVKTIEHESPIDDGSQSWNLVSKDGMNIAYGIYIYHVDAPGVGEKIGKFAIIK